MLLRSHTTHAAPSHWNDVVDATWRAIAGTAKRSWRNAVTRRELATLDDHMLADIGFTRGAALDEADRFPWDDSPRRRQPRLLPPRRRLPRRPCRDLRRLFSSL